jgi:hypothetical protein
VAEEEDRRVRMLLANVVIEGGEVADDLAPAVLVGVVPQSAAFGRAAVAALVQGVEGMPWASMTIARGGSSPYQWLTCSGRPSLALRVKASWRMANPCAGGWRHCAPCSSSGKASRFIRECQRSVTNRYIYCEIQPINDAFELFAVQL